MKNSKAQTKLSFDEALAKLHEPNGQGRLDIELLTYNGFGKKALFLDKVIGKTFECFFSNAIRRKTTCHPERKNFLSPKTKEEVEKLFQAINLTDIEIIEFNGWSKKGIFKNVNTGNIWETLPSLVYRNRSSGRRDSISKIMLRKQETGSIVSYEEAVNRCIVSKNRQDLELQEKDYLGWTRPAKFFDNVVGKHFSCKPEAVCRNNTKHPDRKLENYSSTFTLAETGTSVKDWLETNKILSPTYTTVISWLKSSKNTTISQKKLEEFIADFGQHKTCLEIEIQKMFGIGHWNKTMPGSGMRHRPDFLLSPTLALNIDGLYWHSEKFRTKNSHFGQRKDFEDKGMRIFQFHADELKNSPEIIKSMVKNALGKSENKIYARKCILKIVNQTEATKFLVANHLMGTTSAKHIGLYHEENLVCLMSYKVFPKKKICKIERFCSITNTNVLGGFGKLLNELENNLSRLHTTKINEIHNWVDLRYGTGNHLKNYNFVFRKDVQGFKWTDYKNTYNRLACKANMDSRKMSESDHAKEKGWVKIYDAGQRLFVKNV